MYMALTALLAVLLDRLLGEPTRAHPLVGFGRIACAVEARANRSTLPTTSSSLLPPGEVGPKGRMRARLRGGLAVAVLLLPVTLLCALAVRAPVVGALVEVLLLYLTLGGQSLTEHARRVAQALRANDLAEARRRVGLMVSRDTGAMQSEDVARAGVESVLENGNDAVFGALFWFAVLGAPGAVFYRLANTLDAMWGYRTPRFLYFGWAAARLDDVLNFVPARLTALSYASLGKFTTALRCWRAQARAWESPNAGPVMAAGAGALGVRLGGAAFYHGAWKERPVLGVGAPARAEDIERALRLVWRGIALWLVVLLGIGGYR